MADERKSVATVEQAGSEDTNTVLQEVAAGARPTFQGIRDKVGRQERRARLYPLKDKHWPLLERHALALANKERVQHLGGKYQLEWDLAAALALSDHCFDQLARVRPLHYFPAPRTLIGRLRCHHVAYEKAHVFISWLQEGGEPTEATITQVHHDLMELADYPAQLLQPHIQSMAVGIAASDDRIVIMQILLPSRKSPRRSIVHPCPGNNVR